MVDPGKRITLRGSRTGLTKSLCFKTFSHYSFTEIWNLFYIKDDSSNKTVKIIQEGLIKNNLTARGLAY
jgi:hypothetical protein